MKFFISHYVFPHPHRQLFSLFHLVRVQRDPTLPYSKLKNMKIGTFRVATEINYTGCYER